MGRVPVIRANQEAPAHADCHAPRPRPPRRRNRHMAIYVDLWWHRLSCPVPIPFGAMVDFGI